MEQLFCIEHGHMVMAEKFPAGTIPRIHQYPVFSEYTSCGWELDWCTFDLGYAYCEPPEEYPDWDLDEGEELGIEPDWDEINDAISDGFELELLNEEAECLNF